MKEDTDDLMLDLLCKKAVYGLSEQESEQLAELQRSAGLTDDSQSFELAAAAIGSVDVDTREPLPASLRNRILADAERHFETVKQADRVPAAPITETDSGSGSWFGWLGWAFAAAACLALAMNLYYSRPGDTFVRGGTPTPTPQRELTPTEKRQQLIESAPDLARGSWGPGNVKDVAPAGDIVWSDSTQSGYMRLTGLPVNDPSKETYQLWIFDETQDPKTPIDGGTFNVTSSGEVIIPINAKLRPRNTSMYAITVEKPEGVVVSSREKLIALAKRET